MSDRHSPVHGADGDRPAPTAGPAPPTDQAHVESFFSHLKGDWPHLVEIRDPAALDTELHRIRREYNTVRLHTSIGYVTPDDEHHGRGPAIRRARTAAIRRAQAERIKQNRAKKSMTTAAITDHARPLVLQRDGACLREVVARRHGRRRNPARMTPRSTLRTLTSPSRHHAQRWVRKVGRSITNSETPQFSLPSFLISSRSSVVGRSGRRPLSASACRTRLRSTS